MGVNGIYGLSGSGLDVESLVKVGMLSKQTQYDKLYKQTMKQQWTKEIYSDIYSQLNTFKVKTVSGYKSQSKLNAMNASSSDTSTVSAIANGAAASMSHRVEVQQLSSNAYLLTGEAGIARANTTDMGQNSIKLKDTMFYELTDNKDGTYTYKLDASDPGVTVNASDTAVKFAVNDTTEALSSEDKNKRTVSYTFEDLMNGKTFNDLASNINKLGTSIKTTYDSSTDTFSLYNSVSGAGNTINLEIADAGDGGELASRLFNQMNLFQSVNGELEPSQVTYNAGDKSQGVEGRDGQVKVDGRMYNNVKDNKVTVSGVTYSLLNVSDPGKPTIVTVTQDTNAIIDTVKGFVEDYNKIIDMLQEKYSTKTWSNDDLQNEYEPLSESEKSKMTNEQIESWNEKAKSGLMYHNQTLQKIINSMRDAISTPVLSVNSSYNSASSIGITSSDTKGHLVLDEDKLKTALAADSDCVYQLFASDQDKYNDADRNQRSSILLNDDYNHRGILNRLYYNSLTDGLKDISTYAGTSSEVDDQSTLGKMISNLQDRMKTMKANMTTYQSQLFKKYDAMEQAIAQMNTMYNTIFGASQ